MNHEAESCYGNAASLLLLATIGSAEPRGCEDDARDRRQRRGHDGLGYQCDDGPDANDDRTACFQNSEYCRSKTVVNFDL